MIELKSNILELKGRITNASYLPEVGGIGISISIHPPYINKENLEPWISRNVKIRLELLEGDER